MRFVSIISTHTTLAGGDLIPTIKATTINYFNSHHPCGWRHDLNHQVNKRSYISIHTTLVGGDDILRHIVSFLFDFNPPHPCGWRRRAVYCLYRFVRLFQSTPPLWVETANLYSDTQYFPYRFGEIHNFALSPPTFLSSQSTKTALWAIFLARSSRKFYDCLGFAPSSTYSIISPGWQSRYLHRLSMVLVSI